MLKSSSVFGNSDSEAPLMNRKLGETQTQNWIKASPDVAAQIRKAIENPTGLSLSIRLPPHIQKTFLVENGELSLVGVKPSLSLPNAGIVVLAPDDLDECLKASKSKKSVSAVAAVA